MGSCSAGDSCAVLTARITSKWGISARFAREIACWRHGDKGHQQAIFQVTMEIVKCQEIIAAKCPGLMPTGPNPYGN